MADKKRTNEDQIFDQLNKAYKRNNTKSFVTQNDYYKYAKMMDTQLKGYPRCFFRVSDIPDGYYRVFYKGGALKLCVFVFGGILRCICFDRTRDEHMEWLFFAYEDGKIDIEG